MQLLCDEKALDLRCEVTEHVIVEGDELRLQQIVVNLLDNAIKYTPEGGEIALTVNSAGSIGFLEVTDTGMGISSAALPQVFERFFRAEEARASRLQGTGVGLAIVKSIADAHRGSIQIRSSERMGTTVRIEFALAAPEKDKSNGEAQLVS